MGPIPSSTSPVYKTFAEFKKIAAQVIKAVGARNLPRGGNKWKQVDHLAVLVYGWLRGVSPHHAAEKLNNFAIRNGCHTPATFADGRKSRAVPHQTKVNE